VGRAGDAGKAGRGKGERPGRRSEGEGATDELAQRAFVFLVYARTLGRAVRLDVRTETGNGGVTGRGRVNNADDARQDRLRERSNDDPATNNSRNAPDH
jgi:hypothetical protein